MDHIGKYRILKRLGSGGFGEVYLGHDADMKRDVAIKVFRPKDENIIAFATSSDEEGLQILRERFLREARILASLDDSPHILTVHEFGELPDGAPYYVMPYVARSLKEELGHDVFDTAAKAELPEEDRPRAMDCEKGIALFSQILSGLSEAYEKGLIQRDIKPSNILLNERGQAKIADFGIAKAPDGVESTVSHLGIGSRNYMAPEQRESAKHVDARADVYSLGILAYRMFTGRLPAGRFADPNVHAPQLGKALNQVILQALSEDKEKRYPDAGAMLAAWNTALAEREKESAGESDTSTFTDVSDNADVSGIPQRLKPLYKIIEETLLEAGELTPRMAEIDGMAEVLGLDKEAIDSIVTDVR